MARVLGPDGAGDFNILLSTLGLLLVITALGIDYAVTYFVSRGEWRPSTALRQVAVAAAVLGLAGAAAGMAFAALTADSVFGGIGLDTVAITMAALPFALYVLFASNLALALDRYRLYAAAPALQGLVTLVAIVPLLATMDLQGAALAVLAGRVVTGVAAAFAGHRLGAPEPQWPSQTPAALRRASRFGIHAGMSNVLQQMNYRADVLILAAVASSASVGHYAVALAVAGAALMLPRALSAVLLPRVAAASGAGSGRLAEPLIVKSVRHAVLLGVGTAVALGVVLPAIPLIYGSDFQESVPLGYILLPGVAAVSVANVLAAIVVGAGEPRYSLYNAAIVTPVTLVLYGVLVPTLGASGAAVGSTLSYMASAVVGWVFFRRVTGVGGWSTLRPGRSEAAEYAQLARRVVARVRRRQAA